MFRIIPTYCRYICIEKWSEIFVSAVGNAVYESEEKSLFEQKKLVPTFLTLFPFDTNF